MFHNWYSNDWWRQPTPNCATDQIQSVLEFSLLFGHYPRIPEDMRNVTNVGNLVSVDLRKHSNEYQSGLTLISESTVQSGSGTLSIVANYFKQF